jgi:hypothetical protein
MILVRIFAVRQPPDHALSYVGSFGTAWKQLWRYHSACINPCGALPMHTSD